MFDYRHRLTALQARSAAQDVDAVLLSAGPDLAYITGYEALPSERLTILAVGRDRALLLVPKLEVPRTETLDLVEVLGWGETEDPVDIASSLIRGAGRIAVADRLWSGFLLRFQEANPDTSWVQASEITGPLRLRKDQSEADTLRKAARAVDKVMERVPGEVPFSGRSERDVARHLAELTVEEGHDQSAFTIVASGPNSASPHHDPGDRIIGDGDLVVCDFGGRLSGYFSDSTRTFAVGEPTAEQREIHSTVLAANEAAREVAGPDVPCEEVDRAARSVIAEAGYGDQFIHRTGHGIGLEVHEPPYLVEGEKARLEQGMAFSIEPGVYLEGRFGIRIEDIVFCTEDGAESLNRSDRSLVSVS